MSFDLTNLSQKDLDALISDAKQRKVALKKRKPIAQVREKLAKAARSEGYSLDELFAGAPVAADAPAATKRATKKRAAKRAGKRAAKAVAADKPAASAKKRGRPAGSRAGSKVAAKYRNPANPAEVWTGRGMAPRWMKAYLDQGKSKDDFLI